MNQNRIQIIDAVNFEMYGDSTEYKFDFFDIVLQY